MPARRLHVVPLGLRWRLAAWVALVVLICTAITFVAVYRGTGTQLRGQIDKEIAGDAAEFAHNLLISRGSSPAAVARSATRYVNNQPFSASSTFLMALVPGAGTSTNRPELLPHSMPDNGETQLQQARENRLSTQLLNAPDGYATLALPDVGNLRVLKRSVLVSGGPRVTIAVGEPLAGVGTAQGGVARAFILAGILALAGALVGAYLIGTRVSRPLRRMAAVAARVDAGDPHPRIHNADNESSEIRVLAEAFNHMLDRLTDAFARQRAFVADASHELRTPLTVIQGQVELLAMEEDPPASEVRRVSALVRAEIVRISRLVDDLLLLAKAERGEFLRPQVLDLRDYVEDLWEGTLLLGRRRFELGQLPAGTLSADPDRLIQALRNLLANAVEHTAAPDGLVRLEARIVPQPSADRSQTGGGAARVRFLVDDDGPGIPADQREQIFDRFHRTDAARDRRSGGVGLGLAIVRAIAEAHGGRVAAGRSPEGGARIELELPGFTPASAPAAAHQEQDSSGPLPPVGGSREPLGQVDSSGH
jgi:two-component system, OmpR family, sensor kinase